MKLLRYGLLVLLVATGKAWADSSASAYTALRLGDFERAFALFAQDAESGSADAQHQLGKLFLTGRGTGQSDTRARLWLDRAAASGLAGAQYDLGLLLLDSTGQQAKGRAWLEQASAGGHQQARAVLDELGSDDRVVDDARAETRNSRWKQAAIGCHEEDIANLIDAGADIDSLDGYKRNALYYLVACDKLKGAQLLVENGIDINNIDRFGETSLTLAVKQDMPDMVRVLIAGGATPSTGMRDSSLLHVAVSSASIETLAALLSAKPPLQVVDGAGDTALDLAVSMQDLEAQRLLGDAGARPGKEGALPRTSGDSWSDARQAVVQNQLELLETLLQQHGRSLLSREDERQRTLLMYAVEASRLAAAKLLIEQGASVNQLNSRGASALALTAARGDAPLISLLLDHGADPMIRNAKGEDAISLALDWARSDVAAALLIEHINRQHLSPALAGQYLVRASRVSARNSIDRLSQLNPIIDVSDDLGRTALWYAAQNCDPGTTTLLLDLGSGEGRPDSSGHTPLHAAAVAGCPECTRILLQAGADHSARTEEGNTPLLLASRHQHIETAQALLNSGAKISADNHAGDTPLIQAVRAKSKPLVVAFVEQGADPYRRNKLGESAFTLAERSAPELSEPMQRKRGFLF